MDACSVPVEILVVISFVDLTVPPVMLVTLILAPVIVVIVNVPFTCINEVGDIVPTPTFPPVVTIAPTVLLLKEAFNPPVINIVPAVTMEVVKLEAVIELPFALVNCIEALVIPVDACSVLVEIFVPIAFVNCIEEVVIPVFAFKVPIEIAVPIALLNASPDAVIEVVLAFVACKTAVVMPVDKLIVPDEIAVATPLFKTRFEVVKEFPLAFVN